MFVRDMDCIFQLGMRCSRSRLVWGRPWFFVQNLIVGKSQLCKFPLGSNDTFANHQILIRYRHSMLMRTNAKRGIQCWSNHSTVIVEPSQH